MSNSEMVADYTSHSCQPNPRFLLWTWAMTAAAALLGAGAMVATITGAVADMPDAIPTGLWVMSGTAAVIAALLGAAYSYGTRAAADHKVVVVELKRVRAALAAGGAPVLPAVPQIDNDEWRAYAAGLYDGREPPDPARN